ncbi:HNH endonuclease family protein [Rathayibacter sp. VKM Ac-2926]|uniref:HNH endonuclease family protein n=1 Tax=Rathayibacter sp. VKM Ac-2926 TaxID=2929477 RepID=UPI001FB2A3B0|nr:HNH endonuclease family protein [Rathayibacter sp. VKM Ac-2926]MCJ1702775.1 HNH endonuclease family protein [Rathayibacter sp. VKM Ac-2926]
MKSSKDADRSSRDTCKGVHAGELLDPVYRPGTRDYKVVSGALVDPHDGTAASFIFGSGMFQLVQVGHVVAFGWVWHYGAWAWSDDRRLAFENDLANLAAASDETNRSWDVGLPAFGKA